MKKQRELVELLDGSDWQVITLRDFTNVPDVEENGNSFMENAELKARAASKYTKLLTLAEDSGLEIDALNKAPGIYSARFAKGEDSTDQENIERVLSEMENVPNEQRTARFVCAAVIADGDEILFRTQNTVEGHITRKPFGDEGFGYDPIFFYRELKKTFAEIPSSQKHAVSHRGKALRAVAEFLKTLDNS